MAEKQKELAHTNERDRGLRRETERNEGKQGKGTKASRSEKGTKEYADLEAGCPPMCCNFSTTTAK